MERSNPTGPALPSHARPDSRMVIGHRGACGYLPEHTLASYELAARMGADAIEPDLVSTRDHVLVARHDNELSRTTDVASHPELAHLRCTKVVDGRRLTGWFTEDLTLEQVRSLRAVERHPRLRPAGAAHDREWGIPTLAEILVLRERLQSTLRRPVAVYPEAKHPTHFAASGLPLDEPLVAAVRAAGLDQPDGRLLVQSFEPTMLAQLRHRHGLAARLVLLAGRTGAPCDLVADGDGRTFADLLTRPALRRLAGTVDGIGVDKQLVRAQLPDGTLGSPTSLVDDAHDAGLFVHAYTFRAENAFLPGAYRTADQPGEHGHAVAEQLAYLAVDVDGLFTDHPDVTVAARTALRSGLAAA